MKHIVSAMILASLASAAFGAEQKPQHYRLPDQSGKLTISCIGKPPAHKCDWKKFYCVCDTAPLGYGY